MASYKITIKQVYRVERALTLEHEADDLDSALEDYASGSTDAPSFEDRRWSSGWDLQNEEYEASDEDGNKVEG